MLDWEVMEEVKGSNILTEALSRIIDAFVGWNKRKTNLSGDSETPSLVKFTVANSTVSPGININESLVLAVKSLPANAVPFSVLYLTLIVSVGVIESLTLTVAVKSDS